jgi:hypothetical protein
MATAWVDGIPPGRGNERTPAGESLCAKRSDLPPMFAVASWDRPGVGSALLLSDVRWRALLVQVWHEA